MQDRLVLTGVQMMPVPLWLMIVQPTLRPTLGTWPVHHLTVVQVDVHLALSQLPLVLRTTVLRFRESAGRVHDLHLLDVLHWRPQGDQPDDFRLRDDGGLFQEEVIDCFRLDLPGACRQGQCPRPFPWSSAICDRSLCMMGSDDAAGRAVINRARALVGPRYGRIKRRADLRG